MNLYNITNLIKQLASQIPNVGTIDVGDVYQINAKQDIVYPSIAITQRPHTISHNDEMTTYNFYIFYIDRLTSDDTNRMDVQNAAIEALHSLSDALNDYDVEVVNVSTVHTFNERFNDSCSGAYFELSVTVYNEACGELDLKFVTEREFNTRVSNYQPKLISGVNMKTVNGESLLGEGNIEIKGGGTDLKYYKEDNGVNFNTVDDGSNFSTISNASFGSSLQYGELVDGNSMNPINILDVGFSGVSVYTGDGCVFTYNGEEVATKAYVDSILGDINNRLSKI